MAVAKLLLYGSLNVDYVYQVPHILQPGETLLSYSRDVFAGGKGLNQGVALARAGGDVYFLGAIGEQDGGILLESLKENQINTEHLQIRTNEVSGHTFIQVDENGQNCILLFGGSNRSNQISEIDAALSHFGAGDYLVVQNETNDVAYVITEAHKRGMNVCINVAPIDESVFDLPLHLCKLIIVNEIEGAALVGEANAEQAELIMEKLISKYPQSSILLTLGSQGALLYDIDSKQKYQSSAYKLKAVDTTAAGDTFLGYFITLRSQNMEPLSALHHATAASALAVMKKGAAPSIPVIAEVKTFLSEHGLPA